MDKCNFILIIIIITNIFYYCNSLLFIDNECDVVHDIVILVLLRIWYAVKQTQRNIDHWVGGEGGGGEGGGLTGVLMIFIPYMYDAARRRIEALRNVDQYLKQNEGSMCCLLRLQTMFSKHPCFHRTQCLSQLLFLLHYEMI